MNRRLANKVRWTAARERRVLRRDDRYYSDYWACMSGYGAAPVPGRLLAESKLRQQKAGRR